MNLLRHPSVTYSDVPLKRVGLGCLLFSMLMLLLAPTQMLSSYNWLQHTTSESAAQGIPGAWLARLGFMIFGLTVIWFSALLRNDWAPPVRWLHSVFGVCMVAAAVFSSRPWLVSLPFDPIEDALHSLAATAMGFAFAAGVMWRFFSRDVNLKRRGLDLTAVLASVIIPLSMSALPTWDGLLQRIMFAIAFVWYGFELWYSDLSTAKSTLQDDKNK
jgi:hypothetical protein